MGQVFFADNIPDLAIATTTTITMAATYQGRDTRITVGGQQYQYSTTTTINFATTGLNALDTGAIASNTLYYIYAVVSGGVNGLVASTAAPGTGPTGFTAWKEIGRCRTLSSAATLATIANRDGTVARGVSGTEFVSYTPTGAWVTNTTYAGFWRRVGPTTMEIKVSVVTSGAPTAAALTVSLPTGYTIDTGKLTTGTVNGEVLGYLHLFDSGVSHKRMGTAVYNTNTSFRFLASNGTAGSDNDGNIDNATPFTWAASDAVYANVTLPIVEWQGLYT